MKLHCAPLSINFVICRVEISYFIRPISESLGKCRSVSHLSRIPSGSNEVTRPHHACAKYPPGTKRSISGPDSTRPPFLPEAIPTRSERSSSIPRTPISSPPVPRRTHPVRSAESKKMGRHTNSNRREMKYSLLNPAASPLANSLKLRNRWNICDPQ